MNPELPHINVIGDPRIQGSPEKGIALVDDTPQIPFSEELQATVEPGKTRLPDGTVIDSLKRIFVLAPTKEDKAILSFGDSKTFYTRDAHGSLRRLTPKGKK